MSCIGCDSNNVQSFYTETYPCVHCGEDLTISYDMCMDCGVMWRSVNGEIVEDSIVHSADLMNLLSPLTVGIEEIDTENLLPEDREFVEKIQDEILKQEKISTGEISMADYIHRCIKCNSTAVDIVGDKYNCTDCGFNWEIKKFE